MLSALFNYNVYDTCIISVYWVVSSNLKGKYRQVITLNGLFVHFIAILHLVDLLPYSKTKGHLQTWHPHLSVIESV